MTPEKIGPENPRFKVGDSMRCVKSSHRCLHGFTYQCEAGGSIAMPYGEHWTVNVEVVSVGGIWYPAKNFAPASPTTNTEPAADAGVAEKSVHDSSPVQPSEGNAAGSVPPQTIEQDGEVLNGSNLSACEIVVSIVDAYTKNTNLVEASREAIAKVEAILSRHESALQEKLKAAEEENERLREVWSVHDQTIGCNLCGWIDWQGVNGEPDPLQTFRHWEKSPECPMAEMEKRAVEAESSLSTSQARVKELEAERDRLRACLVPAPSPPEACATPTPATKPIGINFLRDGVMPREQLEASQ